MKFLIVLSFLLFGSFSLAEETTLDIKPGWKPLSCDKQNFPIANSVYNKNINVRDEGFAVFENDEIAVFDVNAIEASCFNKQLTYLPILPEAAAILVDKGIHIPFSGEFIKKPSFRTGENLGVIAQLAFKKKKVFPVINKKKGLRRVDTRFSLTFYPNGPWAHQRWYPWHLYLHLNQDGKTSLKFERESADQKSDSENLKK